MLSQVLFGLVAAKAAIASPVAPYVDFTPDTLAEAAELNTFLQDIQNQKLALNQSEWETLLTQNGILLAPPPIDHDFLNNITVAVDVDVNLNKRCSDDVTRRVTKTESFIDWDMQMSQVVCAIGGPHDIFVANGKTVGNTLTVTAGVDAGPIKSWLTLRFGVEYQWSWSSTGTNQNKMTVNQGNCGVVVLNPTTTRRYGTISKGCIGKEKITATFVSDDRFSASWNGVEWVGGAISDCQKHQSHPPLSRCNGKGDFQ